MHTTTPFLPTFAPLRQALQRTWRHAVRGAAAARERWRAHRRFEREHREHREIALLAELDPRVLKDIGVPEWLEAEAEERRSACLAERDLLRIGGSGIDRRFW